MADNANDGLSLMPYEAMFVPVSTADDVDMPYGFPADTAKRYSEWAMQVRTGSRLLPYCFHRCILHVAVPTKTLDSF